MPLIVVLLLLLACTHQIPVSLPVPTPTPTVTPSPVPLSTPEPGPYIHLIWDKPPPDDWKQEAEVAASLWNRHLGFPVFQWTIGWPPVIVYLEPGRFTYDNEPRDGIATMPAWGSGFMRVNGLLDSPWRQVVLLHEMGHLLGLPHSTTPGALMGPSTGTPNSLTPAEIAAARTLVEQRRSQLSSR